MKIEKATACMWLEEILKYKTIEGEEEVGAPFGIELRKCLDYSLDLLNSLGFTTKNLDGYAGYGEIGSGDLFGILCHLDVVPVSGEWTYPPFSATLHDNKIYARGALDDKGPFICCLYAVAKLLQEGRKPKMRIRFILGCDEESGWKCMDRYTKTEEMPSLGISPDSDFPVINCEKGIVYHTITTNLPNGIFSLKGGERANMVPDEVKCSLSAEKYREVLTKKEINFQEKDGVITLAMQGKSAHGSHPEDGDNAIYKLFKILAEKDENINQIYRAFSTYNGENIGLNLNDEISGGLSLNLGTVAINGDKIVMELDIRHPISYDKDQITEILQKNLDKCEVLQGFFHRPLYVPKEHYLVKTLLKAYNKVMNTQAKPITIGGGTYARVLPLGVAFGPIFPNSNAQIHCVDENIDLNDFYKAAEIYYEAIKEICF